MERITREKEWYNESHGGARTPMGKYSKVLTKMKEHFKNKIYDKLNDNTVFLDYGCGGGDRLIDFHQKIKMGVGIDISEVRIERAKSTAKDKNVANIEFVVMDAMNTVFENEKFDVIRGSAILHHLDLKLSLNEIKRILKKDGYAFFTEPLNTNPIIKLYRKLTPDARTIDEQPLRIKDIKLIKALFPNTEISYFSFFTLLATPFHTSKCFYVILSALSFMDKIILNKRSPFKWLAWYCMLILRK
ncbi:MAG: methyltransferase domain-containing protein [Treponema sp.]|nr:methyltransferase domain-containing protein [Treponema sp.]